MDTDLPTRASCGAQNRQTLEVVFCISIDTLLVYTKMNHRVFIVFIRRTMCAVLLVLLLVRRQSQDHIHLVYDKATSMTYISDEIKSGANAAVAHSFIILLLGLNDPEW